MGESRSMDEWLAYLLPRIRAAAARGDAGCKEVLEYLKVEHLSDAITHTVQSLPAKKTLKLRTWVEQAAGSRFYPYAWLERGNNSAGILLTYGGPLDPVVATTRIHGVQVDADAFEYMLAGMLDGTITEGLRHAAKDVERGTRSAASLEQLRRDSLRVLANQPGGIGRVELREQHQLGERALAALGLPASVWKGGGLYDFKKSPPAYLGTIKEYEYEQDVREARNAIADIYNDTGLAGGIAWACEKMRRANVK